MGALPFVLVRLRMKLTSMPLHCLDHGFFGLIFTVENVYISYLKLITLSGIARLGILIISG
jgi:hypothetical protein